MTVRKAVLLLSGGLDSSTCLLVARRDGFEIHALSFDYGQRHSIELARAQEIARRYGAAEHRVERLDYPGRGASAVTDPAVAVPRGGDSGTAAIPATYVPARNTLFLAHAAAWGETIGAYDIFIGANVLTTRDTRTAARSSSRPSSGRSTWARRRESRARRASGSALP